MIRKLLGLLADGIFSAINFVGLLLLVLLSPIVFGAIAHLVRYGFALGWTLASPSFLHAMWAKAFS
jgi:hypothetical protein